MKFLKSFCMLTLCALGWLTAEAQKAEVVKPADFVDGQKYFIKHQGTGLYMDLTLDGEDKKETVQINPQDKTNQRQIFTFVPEKDADSQPTGKYLLMMDDATYLCKNGAYHVKAGTQAAALAFTVENVDGFIRFTWVKKNVDKKGNVKYVNKNLGVEYTGTEPKVDFGRSVICTKEWAKDAVTCKWILEAYSASTPLDEAMTALNKAIAAAENLEVEVGTLLGQYENTAGEVDAFNAALTAAKEVSAKGKKATVDECNAAKTKLGTAQKALKVVMPQVGKYYVFRSASTDKFFKGGQVFLNTELAYAKNELLWKKAMAHVTNINSTSIWSLEEQEIAGATPEEPVKKVLCLKNLHNGAYVASLGKYNPTTKLPSLAGDQPSAIAFESLGAKQFKIKVAGNGAFFINKGVESAQCHPITGWASGEKGSQVAWYIEEVNVAEACTKVMIDKYDYMTFYSNYATIVPEGVTAYAAVSADNGILKLQAVAKAGEVLAAKTPVIVYANVPDEPIVNEDGTTKEPLVRYDFRYSAEAGNAPTTNLLKGSVCDDYVAPTAGQKPYVMALKNGQIVMQNILTDYDETGKKVTEGGTHFITRANKAYLELPVSAAAQSLRFVVDDDEMTGVEAVETTENGAPVIYDLSGRRVEKMDAKGIYIVNGKKYMMK